MSDDLSPLMRMSRDLAKAARTMSSDEARYLVDSYYMMQEDRKRARNQERAASADGEPHAVIIWFAGNAEMLENQIKRALDKYTEAHPMGSWMRGIYGIGPVLSAGLLAHIDIEACPTVGHIWRYAGLDPTVIWPSSEKAAAWVREHGHDEAAVFRAAKEFGRAPENLRRMATTDHKGQPIRLTAASLANALARRPWNTPLKTLCWKVGQSFMKFSNVEECYYGRIYRERKAYEVVRNDAGGNAAAAAAGALRVGKTTDAYAHYAAGHLPPAQIDGRARRYTVKLFLSHMHGEWHQRHFGRPAPFPYPIAHLGHAHMIPAPEVA